MIDLKTIRQQLKDHGRLRDLEGNQLYLDALIDELCGILEKLDAVDMFTVSSVTMAARIDQAMIRYQTSMTGHVFPPEITKDRGYIYRTWKTTIPRPLILHVCSHAGLDFADGELLVLDPESMTYETLRPQFCLWIENMPNTVPLVAFGLPKPFLTA